MTEALRRPDVRHVTAQEALTVAGELVREARFADALKLLDVVLAADPHQRDALHLAGVCHAALGRYEEALALYDRAMVPVREELMALSGNRAVALGELGRSSEALALLDQVVKATGSAGAHLNRGIIRMQVERFAEAIEDFEAAIALEPTNDLAIYSRGFANLMLGNYREGFRDFEFRKKLDIDVGRVPLWQGEDLAGKRILVHGEMGYGDNIMFARYLPGLVAQGAAVYAVLHKGLRPLFANLPITRVEEDPRGWPSFDYWVPIMSLAHRAGTTLKTVPPPAPVVLNPLLHDRWRGIIGKTDKLKIGLCWSGSRLSKYDQHRSVPLEALAPMLEAMAPSCAFYSLQQDVRMRDAAPFDHLVSAGIVADLEPLLTDYRETAHAMTCLDLIITCDTSIAHMAGTLGIQTLVLLTKFRTYWAWPHRSATTPWYPSLQCVRQTRDGDWNSVVEQLPIWVAYQRSKRAT